MHWQLQASPMRMYVWLDQFNISGTAALVGAMEAYSNMTGETLKAENADAATEELVTTSDLGEAIGDKEQAEELVGAVKEAVVSQGTV